MLRSGPLVGKWITRCLRPWACQEVAPPCPGRGRGQAAAKHLGHRLDALEQAPPPCETLNALRQTPRASTHACRSIHNIGNQASLPRCMRHTRSRQSAPLSISASTATNRCDGTAADTGRSHGQAHGCPPGEMLKARSGTETRSARTASPALCVCVPCTHRTAEGASAAGRAAHRCASRRSAAV
jgi:hypothetical protein